MRKDFMITPKFLYICLIILGGGGCALMFWYMNSKPTTLKEISVNTKFLEYLLSNQIDGQKWTKNPLSITVRYHEWEASDPFSGNFEIKYDRERDIVSVYYGGGEGGGDSIYESYCEYHFVRSLETGYLIPEKILCCWKGRGLLGWSTSPAN